ncbi:LysE family translocator [Maricaulis sp.]|uniref:LysE family translocator n=1 Tax=Maricaulis sp. TaxID=1486257 RepID=UPI001B11FE7E|nr:LysE family transporter [Maricaulis sp.]MBO6763403.1 LysE family transporter [Maricaulis sp.]
MDVSLAGILGAGLLVMASPGPATLAIAAASMQDGRRNGLALAAGVTTGSVTWSLLAAAGLGVVMASHAWAFTLVRYLGAGYLLYLAIRSARTALQRQTPADTPDEWTAPTSPAASYRRGLMIHLTNPKAVLFFGALYSLGLPAGAGLSELAVIVAALGALAGLIFCGYAILFAAPPVARGYARLKRAFSAVFAVLFGGAAIRILISRAPAG